MTIVPVGIFLLFVTIVIGGPRQLLETLEGAMRSLIDAVSGFFS